MTDDFVLSIKNFAAAAGEAADEAVRRVALEVGRRVISRSTPVVDTGRFRANWQFGYDNPPMGETGTFGTSSTPAAPAQVPAMAEPMLGRVVYWVNNVPYAWQLEYGWSSKGKGMVRLTVAEFADIVDDAGKEVAL